MGKCLRVHYYSEYYLALSIQDHDKKKTIAHIFGPDLEWTMQESSNL